MTKPLSAAVAAEIHEVVQRAECWPTSAEQGKAYVASHFACYASMIEVAATLQDGVLPGTFIDPETRDELVRLAQAVRTAAAAATVTFDPEVRGRVRQAAINAALVLDESFVDSPPAGSMH